MRGSALSRLLLAILAVCPFIGGAGAAPTCVRPETLRILQAAALQQQLMVAALTCHYTADYKLFVTTFHDELLKTDRALKQFFLRQGVQSGENGYNAYKSRLADILAQRSLHDPRFCRSSMIAFNVALKRKGAQAELALERPSFIKTGYESCAARAPQTTLASNAALPHLASSSGSSVIVPIPVPRPVRALPPSPRVVERAAPARTLRVALTSNAAPHSALPAVPAYPAKRETLPAGMHTASVAVSEPAPRPVSATASLVTRLAAAPHGKPGAPPDEKRHQADRDADMAAPRYAHATPQRSRAYDRHDDSYDDGYDESYGSAADEERAGPGDNVPNAYKPGAYWVNRREPSPRMVRGPDGRWYLLESTDW